MKKYFTNEEDRAFSQTVLRYNALEDESAEKISLENEIKERTKILLYLIPQRNLSLPEEDAAAFFIDIVKDIDRIVSAFHISGLTFNGYLTQICRYHCMQYMKKKRNSEKSERALFYSDIPASNNYLEEKLHGYIVPTFSKEVEEYIEEEKTESVNPLEMEIAEIIDYIVENAGPDGHVSAREEKLRKALKKKIARRRFMVYLLSLPEVESASFISAVSRVLSVDSAVISRFYMLRHESLLENAEERMKADAIAARYWKALALLRHSIAVAETVEEVEKLKETYERTKAIYEKRRLIANKARRGLSQVAISELLNIPRSTVSNDISWVKSTLERI